MHKKKSKRSNKSFLFILCFPFFIRLKMTGTVMQIFNRLNFLLSVNIIDCFITEYKKTAKLFPGRPLTEQNHYKQKKIDVQVFYDTIFESRRFFSVFPLYPQRFYPIKRGKTGLNRKDSYVLILRKWNSPYGEDT